MAIEIHVNDGAKSGFEFWFEGDGTNKSEKLAQDLMDSATKETSLPSQGVRSEYDHEFGNLAFINKTNTGMIKLKKTSHLINFNIQIHQMLGSQ